MSRASRLSWHIIVVILAIMYIYISTVMVFIDQWFGLGTSPGMLNAVVFTGIAIMGIYNFTLAISTDPGRVPTSYAPETENADNPIQEIKRKSGNLRYCQKCSHYKPPRAHHCRICKRCVLRMDHHCVWMNNCVGNANYKLFFVSVVYAAIAITYSLILYVGSLTSDSHSDQGFFRTIYVISGILLVPLSMALCFFLSWHIYLMLQNKTTIEYYEGVRATRVDEKGSHVYTNPYDLGPYENLISVLGSNILFWIFPTTKHIGSGLRFRTALDNRSAISPSNRLS